MRSGGRGRTGGARRTFSRITARQRNFCHFLARDPNENQTAAAEKAGFSKKHKPLKHPHVRAYYEELKKQIVAEVVIKQEVTAERVIATLAGIAFGDLARFMKPQADGSLAWDFTEATPEELKLIDSLVTETYMEGRGEGAVPVRKFKITRKDQLRALEMLGRYFGLFKEKVEVTAASDIVAAIQAGRDRMKKG